MGRKVLQVIASAGLRHGGISVSVRELSKALSADGWEVSFWTTRRGYDPALDQPSDEALQAAGVGLRYFPTHPWPPLGERYALSPSLASELAENVTRFDLVHIHGVWQHPAFSASRACLRAHTPYILSPCGALDAYGFRTHRLFKTLYGFLAERRTIAGAARIHFTSSLEQHSARLFGAHPPAVVIPRAAPEGLLPDQAEPAQPPRSSPDGFSLLFLGRLQAKKRLDIVAEVFTEVARMRSDVRLVIAGPEEGAGAPLRLRLTQRGLSDRVTFPGPVAGRQKQDLLRASSLFLLPSDDENFGVAALEALAAGVPVLLSPHVALSEWVSGSGAGLVLPQDPRLWAKEILRLLEDPALLQKMSAAGRELVRRQFRLSSISARMSALYRQVVEEHRG